MTRNRCFSLPAILAISAAVTTLALGASAETVWLASLDLTKATQGWGQTQADKSITGTPITIAGQKFERGVGTHAAGTMRIDLGGGAERFQASVGIDDNCKDPRGTVVFRIYGDAKLLFKSPVMKTGTPAMAVDVPLKGVKTLVLISDSYDDGINFDHADWADARFEVTGQKPAMVATPREEPVILTPKPSPQPRINGPRIFGVRPGSPFLFTIAATGDRPMQFSADGLPAGLKLDAATGQITGSLKERGEHAVTLRAKNSLGQAERKFRIVVGDTLALTPPMGWNSWYVLETRVTDKDMRAAADAMVATGMINHGYTYVNIDDCWMMRAGSDDPALKGEPRDAQGRLNPNRNFPDMKAMTDYIHSKGLKAGIYISPGPTTCAGYTGSYQHEEQDARTFADWGFDFLKYDWCSYDEVAKDHSLPKLKQPYQLMGDILKKLDRDIVLNLCQYGMGNVWEWGRDVGGHCWRTAGDLGGSFAAIPQEMFRIGFGQNGLEKWAGPGHWNDPDYLLLGYLSNWNGGFAPTPLSPNEQYTHVTLWCLLASPLVFSGDISRMDDFTLSLLTNDEVLEVDLDPLGQQAHRVAQVDELEVWAKDLEDGSKAVGLFNRGEVDATVVAKWSDLGVSGKQYVRDLWRQKEVGTFDGQFESSVPRHGAMLIRLSPAK
jgi:alpha-galactosidase